MDQIKAENIIAMKYKLRRKKSELALVYYNLIFSSLFALACSVLCSSSLSSSIKHLLFISLPNTWSYFLSPKCLFIVFNVIVAFLVRESKLLGPRDPSPANDIYSEYLERTRILRRQKKLLIPHEGTKEEKSNVCEDKEIVLLEQKQDKIDEEELKEADGEEKVGEDDQSEGLAAEELNRRVEEFIARVNKQRWLEARMLICGQA